MKRKCKDGQVFDITEDMVYRTKSFAHRIGFVYINLVQAIQSYINPITNQKYTEEESRSVLVKLGIDIEKDIQDTKQYYQEYLKMWTSRDFA